MCLTSENPFERNPAEARPIRMSPFARSAPVIRLSFWRTPTAVAFQTLPFTELPTSASSPPGITTLFSMQAFPRPLSSSSIVAGSILSVSSVFEIEIVSAPTQAASSATIARRS